MQIYEKYNIIAILSKLFCFFPLCLLPNCLSFAYRIYCQKNVSIVFV